MKALIYDLEIIRAIPGKNEPPIEGIEYCAGWHDHAGMGISVLGAYDYFEDRFRIFCDDNKQEFFDLAQDRLMVSFNGLSFDNMVIAKCWDFMLPGRTDFSYDILVEVWAAVGLGPKFRYPSHMGYGLDAVYQATFHEPGKTGHGALAPVQWQRGQVGAVIDYCIQDVKMTKRLFDSIMKGEPLENPKGGILEMRRPDLP